MTKVDPRTERVNIFLMAVDPLNIGIRMKRKEQTKTLTMISYLKKDLWHLESYKNIAAFQWFLRLVDIAPMICVGWKVTAGGAINTYITCMDTNHFCQHMASEVIV